MALTDEDLTKIQALIAPMFEYQTEYMDGRFSALETRMDGLETRVGGLENAVTKLDRDFNSFRYEVDARFKALEAKLDDIHASLQSQIENLREDVDLLFKLVGRYSDGTPEQQAFVGMTVEKQVPVMYKLIVKIARENNIKLPKLS